MLIRYNQKRESLRKINMRILQNLLEASDLRHLGSWFSSLRGCCLCLMFELRAGSEEWKVDGWEPMNKKWNPCRWPGPAPVFYHLQFWWYLCPEEEASALFYRVKYASGPRTREAERSQGSWSSWRPDCFPTPRWASRLMTACVNCTSLPSIKTVCCCFTSALQLSGKMSPKQKHSLVTITL